MQKLKFIGYISTYLNIIINWIMLKVYRNVWRRHNYYYYYYCCQPHLKVGFNTLWDYNLYLLLKLVEYKINNCLPVINGVINTRTQRNAQLWVNVTILHCTLCNRVYWCLCHEPLLELALVSSDVTRQAGGFVVNIVECAGFTSSPGKTT